MKTFVEMTWNDPLGTAAPLAALLGDSDWPPIQLHLQLTMLKYWFRVHTTLHEKLDCSVFYPLST